MMELNKFLNNIKNKKIQIGINSVNRNIQGVVYYTMDAPMDKIIKKSTINYIALDVNNNKLSNSLGVDYPVHFVYHG